MTVSKIEALQIAISSVIGYLPSKDEAVKISLTYGQILNDPDSFTIKQANKIKDGKNNTTGSSINI